jgi:hypothetical protein
MSGDYKFEFGFWHPFGNHGGEPENFILWRNAEEIERLGWTVRSFQARPLATLRFWYERLARASGPVLVLCSNGGGTRDPAFSNGGTISDCKSYQTVDDPKWRPLPQGIRNDHPFRTGITICSAFIIKRVVKLAQGGLALAAAEWLDKDGSWRSEKIPTRGEYLIRPRGTIPTRRACAILELAPPYLARLSAFPNGEPS